MRSLLLIILLIALAFFASQRIITPQLHHNSITDRLQHPFDTRLRYRIGEVDPRFNLSHDQVQQIAQEAVDIWTQGTAQTLFVYDPQAKLAIHLIYDQRQADSDARRAQIAELEHHRKLNQAEYQNIRTTEYQLNSQQKRIEQYQRDYNQQLERYNQEVKRFNQSSTQSQTMLNYLQQRKAQLHQQAQQLQNLIQDFNQEVSRANQLVNQYSQQNQAFNQSVTQFNQRFQAKQFDKGQFNGQAIKIYEFQGIEDLRLTIAHELGHALGLAHTEDPESLMYPVLEKQDFEAFTLKPADLQLFQQQY